jgi:hypothetical protein
MDRGPQVLDAEAKVQQRRRRAEAALLAAAVCAEEAPGRNCQRAEAEV